MDYRTDCCSKDGEYDAKGYDSGEYVDALAPEEVKEVGREVKEAESERDQDQKQEPSYRRRYGCCLLARIRDQTESSQIRIRHYGSAGGVDSMGKQEMAEVEGVEAAFVETEQE